VERAEPTLKGGEGRPKRVA